MLILMAISLISPVHPLSWGSGSAPAWSNEGVVGVGGHALDIFCGS